MKRDHELWQVDDDKCVSTSWCFAGPAGDDARRLLGPDARLIWTFVAGSHFEAMTAFHEFMGWDPYTVEPELEELAKEPYPDN